MGRRHRAFRWCSPRHSAPVCGRLSRKNWPQSRALHLRSPTFAPGLRTLMWLLCHTSLPRHPFLRLPMFTWPPSPLHTNRPLTMHHTTHHGGRLAQHATTAASGAIFPSSADGASAMNVKHFLLRHVVIPGTRTTTDRSHLPILAAAHLLLRTPLIIVPPAGLTAADPLHLSVDFRLPSVQPLRTSTAARKTRSRSSGR